MIDKAKINIVDEEGKIIGEDTRENAHEKGLLHREVHVWFYTPNGQLIFQHRVKNKDTFPDKLDATAGGHIDLGMNWEDTAVKEVYEETGIVIGQTDLKYITVVRSKATDRVTGKINNVIRKVYAFLYTGKLEELHGDPDEVEGFEVWDIDALLDAGTDKSRIISMLVDEESLGIYRKIKSLIK